MTDELRTDLVNNEIDRLIARIEALESENGELLVDLTNLAMYSVDACDICKHNLTRSQCENYDYDCALCNAVGCICAACRDGDRFMWRGMRDHKAPKQRGTERRAEERRNES